MYNRLTKRKRIRIKSVQAANMSKDMNDTTRKTWTSHTKETSSIVWSWNGHEESFTCSWVGENDEIESRVRRLKISQHSHTLICQWSKVSNSLRAWIYINGRRSRNVVTYWCTVVTICGIIWFLSALKGGSAGGCTQETTWHAFCTRGLKGDDNLSSRGL